LEIAGQTRYNEEVSGATQLSAPLRSPGRLAEGVPMIRTVWAILSALLLGTLAGLAVSEERPRLQDALALEEAMHEAIKKAEPSVACVLVPRSTAYQQQWNQGPAGDDSGRLGGFDPSGPIAQANNNRLEPEQRRTQLAFIEKHDLANPNTVPEAFGSGIVVEK